MLKFPFNSALILIPLVWWATEKLSFAEGAADEQRRAESAFQKIEEDKKFNVTRDAPQVELTPPTASSAIKDGDETFVVEKINVIGNTKLSESEIQSIVGVWEGKMLTLAQAQGIAESLTQLYFAKGFITCRAYLPPQQIDSTLEIQALEGTLGNVEMKGQKFVRPQFLMRGVEKKRGEVIDYPELLDEIYKMNLHPDRQVKAVIRPGQDMGTSDLLLDVNERFPVHLGAEVNNYGTHDTGKERYHFSLRHNNVLGLDDRLALRVQTGKYVSALSTQYARPVGEWNTEVGGSFNHTEVSIAGDFADLEAAGTAYSYSAFANQPFWKTANLDLTANLRFEGKSIDNEALNVILSEDELRMIRTGITADVRDPFGRTFLINELTFGVPWLGASDKNHPKLSREGAGASFFKYNGNLTRVHPIYEGTHFYMRASAQYTEDALVSAEQYEIGGIFAVRGYPQSDYLADTGGGGSIELRVPFYFIPRDYKVPFGEGPLWNRCHFFGFFDGAYGHLKKAGAGDNASKTNFGVGGGIRFDLPRNLSASFEWGAPVGDASSESSNSQFYFVIRGDLF